MESTMTDLRYPVGQLTLVTVPTRDQVAEWIDEIAATPAAVRAAIDGLGPTQLDTPYRPDGWTVRQVVHHLADSHLNAYVRFKLALTEDTPTIKPYDEAAWAELEDTKIVPVSVSLDLLDALHIRWTALLRSLSADDLERDFRHPEKGRLMRLDTTLGMYAWHGKHHVAHITGLREREGW